MNYQEFRDLWHDVLREARLQIPYPIGPTEKINLSKWDDPEKRDPSPVDELRDFALRISRAMSVMDTGLAHLVKSKP